MDELSEELQARHGKRLAAAPDGTRGLLEPNLLDDLHQTHAFDDERAAPRRRWIVLALAAMLLGVLSYQLWAGWQWSQRVHAMRVELARWPGFVLLKAQSPRRGELVVDGLYDPAGGDPRAHWTNGGHAAADRMMSITWSLRPYISLEPNLVTRRAARLLGLDPRLIRGPDAQGVLHLVGTVPFAQWHRLRALEPFIPGVERVDSSRLDYLGAGEIDAAVARIEEVRIGFTTGVIPDAAADAALRTMLTNVDRLQALAAAAGISVQLHAFGLTDEPGGSLVNRDLRMRRAEWLAQRLAPALQPPTRVGVDLDTLSALEFHGTARAALIRIDLQPTGPLAR
jgi:OOP family OmpA-OmpF porin